MPKVKKTLHVSRCGSQQSSGQRNVPDREQAVEQAKPPSGLSRTKKRGNKRGNDKCVKTPLKVKFSKLNSRALPGNVNVDDKTPASGMLEPNKLKTAANQGTIRDPAPALDARDVFSFSQRSNIEATNEKEKAKLSVLRTISKMLEENQIIRQRLAALKLTN